MVRKDTTGIRKPSVASKPPCRELIVRKRNMENFVGYARVSDKERQGDNTSIPNQKFKIAEYCKSKNYNLIKIFEDKKSGKNVSRAGLQAMLKFIEEYDIQGVLLYDTNRFSRRVKDAIELEEGIKKSGARVEYVLVQFDDSPEGWLFKTMKQTFDEFYIRDLSRKMKTALESRARSGYWVSFAPYGYKYNWTGIDKSATKVQKKLIPDKNFNYIKKAWLMLLQGYRVYEIVAYLQKKNVRSRPSKNFPKGVLINSKRISDIFDNPVYYGAVINRGIVVCEKGIHKPMITKAQFQRAQKIRQKNSVLKFENLYNYSTFSRDTKKALKNSAS